MAAIAIAKDEGQKNCETLCVNQHFSAMGEWVNCELVW